jgi:hypothetical protein
LTTRFNSEAALLTPASRSWAIAVFTEAVIPQMNAAPAGTTLLSNLPKTIMRLPVTPPGTNAGLRS